MTTVEELIEKASRLTDDEHHGVRVAWAVAGGTAWEEALGAAGSIIRVTGRSELWKQAHREVGPAIWPVVTALLARDLLSEEHFNTLYGPWASVMERA